MLDDRSVLGWLIAAGYIAAALLCWRNWHIERHGSANSVRRRWWFGLAVALAFLAVNKELDFQTSFLHSSRSLFRRLGWEEQIPVVRYFAVFIAFGLVSVAIWALLRGPKDKWRLPLGAILGAFMLIVFITLRAAGIRALSTTRALGEIHLLEPIGITMICVSALLNRRQESGSGPRRSKFA